MEMNMNIGEQTLLLGALRSVKTVALQGCASTETEILGAIKLARKSYETWDLRAGRLPTEISGLREDISKKLSNCPTMVLLLPAKIPDMVREVLGELAQGALKINPDAPQKLADDARVIALTKEKVLSDEIAGLFNLVVSGAILIEEQRAAARKVEESLRAAQTRARESSRQHGLA
jgi:hypothetical protein